MQKILIIIAGMLLFPLISFADRGFATLEEFLTQYIDIVDDTIDTDFTAVDVKYTNVAPHETMYETLQKAIYLDVLPNLDIALPLSAEITKRTVKSIIEKHHAVRLTVSGSDKVPLERLDAVRLKLQQVEEQQATQQGALPTNLLQRKIFQDVYHLINKDHIDAVDMDAKQLLYGMMKGMTSATQDTYTSFFTPDEAETFQEELNGSFEGIGAYVEMPTAGEVLIVSPIKGSPADDAGLQPGDKIIAVDEHVIGKNTTLEQTIGWIKGPAGSRTLLTIVRDTNILRVHVTRAAVTIPSVSVDVFNHNNCYVSLRVFSRGMAGQFADYVDELASCTKIILDVRNNPGGSYDDVVDLLSYFVPTGKPTVIAKRKNSEEVSYASDHIKLYNKDLVFLVNKGSASASEIFVGTVKDYFRDAVIVGEKTFGKGSVQSLVNYADGSMLKYTIARWFTGKTQQTIDGVGIIPDKNIVDNPMTAVDEVLRYAEGL